ncbi:hypothetical protein V1506DRAFT_525072 [Lipomyces tetrasporus]
MLLDLKDPAAALPRKYRPRGTRRLKASGLGSESGLGLRKCPKLSNDLTTTENETTVTEQDERTMQQLVASDDADSRRDEEFEEMSLHESPICKYSNKVANGARALGSFG